MAPPLIVRAVLDAASYLKVSESVVSSNTLMGDSALGMGADFTRSAQAQVAAGVKVIQSQRLQIAEYAKLEAAAVAGSDAALVAGRNRVKAEAALNRSLGITTLATRTAGAEAKTAERDVGKLTRGALAGSGVFSKLGRSLAFASSGFIAVAGGATLIAESIRQAEALGVAQRQVDTQLKTSGKSWAQYGTKIDSVLLKEGHLAGFTRSQLLQAFGYLLRVGGNVQRSLDLTGLAANVARGRSISLQAASIALSKALGGSATALRRLGIIVPNNVTKMQALAYVQQKFAGQAEAGTSVSQRFSAALTDAGATIGTALLPTFDRLLTHFGDWVQKMNQSGKLTRDVNAVVHDLGIGFHLLGKAISVVDKVTGGFGHTLIAIGEIWAGIKILGWISALDTLALKWGAVEGAATGAATAEAAAAGGAGRRVIPVAPGVGAGVIGGLLITQSPEYKKFQAEVRNLHKTGPIGSLLHDSTENIFGVFGQFKQSFDNVVTSWKQLLGYFGTESPKFTSSFGRLPAVLTPRAKTASAPSGLLPSQLSQFTTTFALKEQEQIAQAQASLTRGTGDDVSAARNVLARIRLLIGQNRVHGKALIQALGLEASALSTIWTAEDAAAQKRAAAAQAAQERIQAQIQDSIDPLRLEVSLSRAQALGKPIIRILKELRAAAEKALKSGKLSLEQQKEAWDQITSINQQISSAMKSATKSALGNYKQLNIDKIAKSLHLTAEQSKALKSQLSQVGPHGTVPGSGVGAYGYRATREVHHHHFQLYIDGKPVETSVRKHADKRRRRNSSQRRGPNAGT